MIVASRQLNGKTVYSYAGSGKRYRPGRIPDDAIRFLAPGIPVPQGFNNAGRISVKPDDKLVSKPKAGVKPSWLMLLLNWIKSLFNGNKY